MRRLVRWLLILGVLAGLTAAVAVPAKSWWQQRSVPKYVTATVSRGRVETVVNSTGNIKPVRTVSVGAFTSGPIKRIYVDYNSVVKKGDPLADIDPKLAEATVAHDTAALNAQKADLERVEALLLQATKNEKRATDLQTIKKDFLSEADMDTYMFAVLQNKALKKLGEASIKQAEATLENSRANLEYTKILSPEDGKIIERKVDKGQTVAASFQTPELFTMGLEMDEHMHVYVSVDEADIGQITQAWKQKRPAKFTVDAYPGEVFEGEIFDIRLNSATTQNVVTYPVIIDAPNKDLKLLPGMTANISFQIEAKENVLRIPAAALRFVPQPAQVHPDDRHYLEAVPTSPAEVAPKRTANQKAEQARNRQRRVVWVQDELLLRAVPVTLGLIENQFAEVVSGNLSAGQAVVTGTEGPIGPR